MEKRNYGVQIRVDEDVRRTLWQLRGDIEHKTGRLLSMCEVLRIILGLDDPWTKDEEEIEDKKRV